MEYVEESSIDEGPELDPMQLTGLKQLARAQKTCYEESWDDLEKSLIRSSEQIKEKKERRKNKWDLCTCRDVPNERP